MLLQEFRFLDSIFGISTVEMRIHQRFVRVSLLDFSSRQIGVSMSRTCDGSRMLYEDGEYDHCEEPVKISIWNLHSGGVVTLSYQPKNGLKKTRTMNFYCGDSLEIGLGILESGSDIRITAVRNGRIEDIWLYSSNSVGQPERELSPAGYA